MDIRPAELLQLREEEDGVVIPLDHNRNDKNTVFAGSIYAGAVLAGYRLCQRLVAEQGFEGELVAESAAIEYLAPIASDAVARVASVSGPTEKPNGNRVIHVRVEVRDAAERTAATAEIRYVLVCSRGSY